MNEYTNFAKVYDMFMDNVPYDEWCGQIEKILLEHDIKSGIIAELGCGTGNLTSRLSAKGYDMIGIDNSEDMLEIAMDKKVESKQNILYLCQDMRSFELYGTCRAIVSRCDSINYIESYEDLVSVFRLVNNYLDPQGLFIYDANTIHKYETVLADNTVAENRKEGSFIWENAYDPETGVNEYDLTLYIRDTDHSTDGTDRFLRFEETHYQKAWTLDDYKRAADTAGLTWVEAVDAETLGPVTEHTDRYLITLMEHGKDVKND